MQYLMMVDTVHWRQRADERLGDPPTKVHPGALVVRDMVGKPSRGLPGSALLLCV